MVHLHRVVPTILIIIPLLPNHPLHLIDHLRTLTATRAAVVDHYTCTMEVLRHLLRERIHIQ
jgi:hypothetical protein